MLSPKGTGKMMTMEPREGTPSPEPSEAAQCRFLQGPRLAASLDHPRPHPLDPGKADAALP